MTVTPAGLLGAYLDNYEAAHYASQAPHSSDLLPALDTLDHFTFPFSYAVGDGFLPQAALNAARGHWPDDDRLAVPNLPAGGYGAAGSRKAVMLSDWGLRKVQHATAPWDSLAGALCAPAFVRTLLGRFAPQLESHLGSLEGLGELRPGFRLQVCRDHGPGEALGAHLDGGHKLLTIVIYLDLAGDTDEHSAQLWGTSLYATTPGAVPPVRFMPNSEHTPAAQVLFQPNRAFVMPNASNALHGVIGSQPGVIRRSIMCGYWAFGPERAA